MLLSPMRAMATALVVFRPLFSPAGQHLPHGSPKANTASRGAVISCSSKSRTARSIHPFAPQCPCCSSCSFRRTVTSCHVSLVAITIGIVSTHNMYRLSPSLPPISHPFSSCRVPHSSRHEHTLFLCSRAHIQSSSLSFVTSFTAAAMEHILRLTHQEDIGYPCADKGGRLFYHGDASGSQQLCICMIMNGIAGILNRAGCRVMCLGHHHPQVQPHQARMGWVC